MFPLKKKQPAFGAPATPKFGGPPKPGADDLDAPDPVEGKPMPEESPDEEAGESPDEESGEDYGAKLVADIEAAGKRMGMEASDARLAAGEFFKAVANCLSGDSGDAGADANGSDTESYPA